MDPAMLANARCKGSSSSLTGPRLNFCPNMAICSGRFTDDDISGGWKLPSLNWTSILDGVWTSKEAVALNEKEANGVEIVEALIIVMLLESISWDILSTLVNGVAPASRIGRSSEYAVYLKVDDHAQLSRYK